MLGMELPLARVLGELSSLPPTLLEEWWRDREKESPHCSRRGMSAVVARPHLVRPVLYIPLRLGQNLGLDKFLEG